MKGLAGRLVRFVLRRSRLETGELPAGVAALLVFLLVPGIAGAQNPGALIENQATLVYESPVGVSRTQDSNPVALNVAVVRSSASLSLTRVLPTGGTFRESVGPSACFDGSDYVVLGDPTLIGGTEIDASEVQEVSATESYNQGEPIFLRLDDRDQNVDFQVVDTAEVTLSNALTGDEELVRLSETGVNTGVFAGYIGTAGGAGQSGDCVLQVAARSAVGASYLDPADPTDSAADSRPVDPTQRVFETRTGTLVSGATIELVDATTGLPATVLGNDGVSQFPAAITSGGTVTDSGGTQYVFAPGEYRFPVVPDGDYRLVVTPPPAFAAPSTLQPDDLNQLPGAPFDLGDGSYGLAFSKAGELSIAFDIPVDPQSTALFMQKRTQATTAAPGDFVRYELIVENASAAGGASDLRVVDELPLGVRFMPGTVTIDGDAAADPEISADRRTLTFRYPALAINESVTLAYVVEVIGGKPNTDIVNRATAFAANGLFSNEATVGVRLTEDLFRSTATLIGRVIEGDCSQQSFGEEQGVAGIRVYLEDGRYAVSDEGGRFHFEGLTPGTHVAQLDTFSVPEWFDIVGCSDDPAFAGRGDSRFVRLGRGAMKRADFFLKRKPAPEGRLELELLNSEASSADEVNYTLNLTGIGNVAIENIDVQVLLPDGVSYRSGTMRVDGANLGDPRVAGPSLSFALPDQRGGWTSTVTFTASIDAGTEGVLSSKAIATFDTPIEARQRTPVGETRMLREPGRVENAGYVLELTFDVLSDRLSAGDAVELDRLIRNWQGVANIQISAVGHSDSTPIRASSRTLFADNYALSRARAAAAAAYLASALSVPLGNVQVAGRGPDEPVADNGTAAGRQKNRRVELIMSGIRPTHPSFLEVTQASSGQQAVATKGAVPGTERIADVVDEAAIEEQVEPALLELEAGIGLVLPTEGFEPTVPTLPVSVRHAPGQKVTVRLNGLPVNPLTFDSVETRADGKLAISRWRAIRLNDGVNELQVFVADASGRPVKTLSRSVYYGGPPIRAEFLPEESVLIADGKTRPVIAVRLFDRSGRVARPGVVGDFSVAAPYRSWWDVDNSRRNQLAQVGERRPSYRVGGQGIARIELEPTTRTGEVTVSLPFQNTRQQEVRAWLEPAERDWILVGFAEGTAGYATLSDNLEAAADAGVEEGYYDEGRAAFFAKGRIRGEYLLTLSYDTARDRDETRNRFDTEIDPTAFYSLYGDGSEQRFEAASQRKLYVKLERRQFYALFGDYAAGLTVTDLARFDRRFNGLKSEFRGEHVGYSAFAAETDQAFNRDELRGDGTSGLYRLSRAPIIVNSESIRLEIRDRFDSGIVLRTERLTRFLDYNLDPLNGTLFFKKPVPSRDLEFNPIYIIAEYETLTDGTEDVVAGGRASLRFAEDAVEVGATYVDDQTAGAEADLSGVDLRWQINNETELRAEWASSERTNVAGERETGSAHSITLNHSSENVDVRAYVREVEDSFGLGYQAVADQGFRRLAVDFRAKVSERLFLEGEAGWQQNLDSEDIRNLARLRTRYNRGDFSATVGVSHTADKFDDGQENTSNLGEITLAQGLWDNAVTFRASASTSLGGEAESVDFPTSYIVGADYRVLKGVDLVAEYEEASGPAIDASMTRVGLRAQPFARTQMNTFVTNEMTEFGPRVFANFGLVQGVRISERWSLDFGVDQAKTLLADDARVFDPDRELVTGTLNDDFTSVFAGAMYSADLWSANSRIEVRDADSERRSSMTFGWFREPQRGLGLSAGLLAYRSELETGDELTAVDFRFGWAYRVADRKWAFLDRIDLIYEDRLTSGLRSDSWRLINNLVANRRLGAASELSLQYAFKYVRSNFDELRLTGYSDLIGADYRRGFANRWDIGAHASVYNAYESGTTDFGTGVDVGYNVATNVWITLGYNFTGFHDSDFAAARYTAQGPYLRFAIKADQHSLRRIAGR